MKECQKCHTQNEDTNKECKKCSYTSFIHSITITDKIRLGDNIKIRGKRIGFKKFFVEHISGWFPNIITGDSKFGVNKTRIIDKEKDEYHEIVKDLKTGEIIRDCHEPLSKHKK